eukprot:3934269-Rhodomonas_salina.2
MVVVALLHPAGSHRERDAMPGTRELSVCLDVMRYTTAGGEIVWVCWVPQLRKLCEGAMFETANYTGSNSADDSTGISP